MRGGGCLSGTVFLLSSLLSMQRRSDLSFFLTQTIGAAYGDLDLTIHPFANNSWMYFYFFVQWLGD